MSKLNPQQEPKVPMIRSLPFRHSFFPPPPACGARDGGGANGIIPGVYQFDPPE